MCDLFWDLLRYWRKNHRNRQHTGSDSTNMLSSIDGQFFCSCINVGLAALMTKITTNHRVERLFLLFSFSNVELISGLWDSGFSRSENLRGKNSEWFLSSKRCTSSGCVCLPSKFFPSSISFKAQTWPTVCALFHQFCVRRISPLVWFMRCKHVICRHAVSLVERAEMCSGRRLD